MSKKQKTEKTKFDYTPTAKLPKIKLTETWDLKTHYYKNENDPQIEKDAAKVERAISAFVKKYKNKDFTSSTNSLLAALKDNDKLAEVVEDDKIMRYFSFRTTLDVNDDKANKKYNQFANRFKMLSNDTVFFSLKLGATPKSKQREYLKEPKLTKYHYLLKGAFEAAKHQLSEAEEKILTLRSNTSSGMWADAVEKVTSNRKIIFKGTEYSIPEALVHIDHLSWKDKGKLWDLILNEMVQIGEFAEHELTALVTHTKVSHQLRSYEKPYSATVKSYENNEKSVEALVEAISKEGFALSKKFYKLKAKLHGMESIPYVNRYDEIGTLPKPSYEQSIEICRDAFYETKTEYGQIFDRIVSNGQVDVYPKKGKRGGAFMAGSIGLPTYVMLNHTNNFKSLETLAHEMGHAVHAERSKQQPAIYEGFSTTTAETASTLFEQIVLDKILEQLTDDQKIIFLHDKLTRDISTVQRQIAFFNFELSMHNFIRTEGAATRDELAKMMEKALKDHLGPAVEIAPKDGHSYVYVPHIRYGFYVYTYAYGHLMSNLMASKLRTDPSYIDKIDHFLSAGCSDTVENIFKAIGINANKIETFTDSLQTQASEIALLAKLTK